jgi:hypothetical protein
MKKLLLILLCLPMIGFGQSWVGDGYGHYNNIYLYLIGWGDNSTIAYLNVERFEDATATGWEGDLENRYEIKLVVQDLKSDKILFSNLMDEFKDELGQNALSILPDCCDEHFTIDKDIFSEDCFLYFYSKNKPIIDFIFKKYNIEKSIQPVFYNNDNSEYKFTQDTICRGSEEEQDCSDFDFGNRIVDYTLYLIDNGKRKLVSKGTFDCVSPPIKVYGYFKSPNENIICVLFGCTQATEGESLRNKYLHLAGCKIE